jgi:predicted DNA binding CopG/RHH family protein
MSKQNSWDALLERDWADAWDSLPEAPEWEPRAKTAQITLRLPGPVLGRIKQVAARRSLPYHALARSWIADGLRQSGLPDAISATDERLTEQLNIKLDQALLDDLKARAHGQRYPYHRLAREWIESALVLEEGNLGLDQTAAKRPSLMELMVFLLHSSNTRGEDVVRGITRLQKLLFVVEQKLSPTTDYYAYNFGPFDEEVNKTAEALRLAGFVQGGHPATSEPLSFAVMMAVVAEKAGPGVPDDHEPRKDFVLTDVGHERAERLRKSSVAYQRLASYVAAIRQEYDKDDLVERVYSEYPQFAENSLIRDKVARRAARRTKR